MLVKYLLHGQWSKLYIHTAANKNIRVLQQSFLVPELWSQYQEPSYHKETVRYSVFLLIPSDSSIVICLKFRTSYRPRACCQVTQGWISGVVIHCIKADVNVKLEITNNTMARVLSTPPPFWPKFWAVPFELDPWCWDLQWVNIVS